MPEPRRDSREAALTELQRLHAAILASRERRGAGVGAGTGASPMAVADAAPSPEALAAQELTRRLQADAPIAEAPESRGGRRWWIAVAAAVVVAGVWVAMSMSQRSEVVTEAAPPKAAPPAGPAAVAPPLAAATAVGPSGAGSSPASAPAAVAPTRPVQVTLTAVRPVWLRVTVDGARALQREVAAGETLSFGGDQAVVVRSGDAGGVTATVNGADRGALGLRGWPLTVAITPEGIRPLTPTRPED